MKAIPRRVTKIDDSQAQKDLEFYQSMAMEIGADDAAIIRSESLVVQERIRAKCSIPKCAEYGTNLHCPPYSPTVHEIKKILEEYNYGIAVRLSIKPEYTAGALIHNCYLRAEIDNEKHYVTLGRKYKKMFFIVSEIESKAFYDGYYFAMGFAAGSCKNVFCFKKKCQGLTPGAGCRNPLRARPSMEAVGFDAYGMANNLGWPIYPIGGRSEPENVPSASLLGLILIM
ncbi:MAG: DUF2284 domain-containing protein [Deltaproteobacteria bacterium]|nr:DUF2284 domain-containing protein [Deltaproteobacteria bacterium]